MLAALLVDPPPLDSAELELEPTVAVPLLLPAPPVLVPELAVVSLPDMPCVVVGPLPLLPVEPLPLVPVLPAPVPVEPTPELLASVVVPDPPHPDNETNNISTSVDLRSMPR